MDLPNEIVDAIAPAMTDVLPPRLTRSAQRRRVAAGEAASPAPIAAVEPSAASDFSPFDAEPVAQPIAAPAAPVSAAPVSFDPPAAAIADTTQEDQTMDTIDTAATTANDAAAQMAGRGQAAFADMNGRAKDALEKSARMAEELGAFGKGNLEAMVESSKIIAKGFETISQEAAEFTRRSLESATAAMKTLAATRSPTEFMKLQSDYARSMFDAMVAETSKSTEMMLKLTNDVAQPLSNRVAVAAEKMKVTA